eukprot:TRINITY_DN2347_c0_g1_i2.p1 TRINITY_DN2347_c0_g1~~TRINITY_DN2347_c0_g1_i2.p1  ORF type:complete len:152 (-),score=17.55 TRINITY_DN2347_c0_g1_i2:148-603(-)
MTYKRVNVSTYDKFDQILEATIIEGHTVLVYVSSTIDPLTNKPWCSDCYYAAPNIPILYDIPNLAIVECPVVEENYREPTHPYRIHPELQIKHIPTLIHWKWDGPGIRLVEKELHNVQNLIAFKDHVISEKEDIVEIVLASSTEDNACLKC